PGISADDDRSSCFDRLVHRLDVRTAAALTPTDQPVVGFDPHDDVGHPVAMDPATEFALPIRDADDRRVEPGDFHRFILSSPISKFRTSPVWFLRSCAGPAPPETVPTFLPKIV